MADDDPGEGATGKPEPGGGPEAVFRAHLAAGRLMLQRARGSGRFVFPPRVAEPGTGARDLEWVEASGQGVVHATTVVRVRPPGESYDVCLVDLAEGPRIMGNVEGLAPGQVRIGMAVLARVDPDGPEGPRVVFRPAPEEEASRG